MNDMRISRDSKAAKLSRRAGWTIFGILTVAAYSGYGGFDFYFAAAVGVTWLAYYFFRFALGGEVVADPEVGMLLFGALMVIFAWGKIYSGDNVKTLLADIEKTCNGIEARKPIFGQAGPCRSILEDVHSYQDRLIMTWGGKQ
jgi:hypothetical protein